MIVNLMKLTGLLFCLFATTLAKAQNPKEIQWGDLIVKEFIKKWDKQYFDSIPNAIYNEFQKGLNGSNIRISGTLLQFDTLVIIVDPDIADIPFKYLRPDQVIYLCNSNFIDIDNGNRKKFKAVVTGNLLVNVKNDIDKVPYSIHRAHIRLVNE